jgi:triphosphoribosyl-dephospho-CoA synthase
MNSLPISELERLAAALVKGARLELYLTPKPGLVDLADSGSHADLSLPVMEASIAQVAEYLDAMVVSLAAGEPFAAQRRIGMAAEQRLLATLGTNTHKGFIFLSGMLLIARRHAESGEEKAIRAALATLAAEFFASGERAASNGQQARSKYGAGGIVAETMHGFPSIFDEALPAFRRAMSRAGSVRTASFAMLARLMQTVDDTTTLHRAGPPGLRRLKADGRALEELIAGGVDCLPHLDELNRTYIRLNITMGGVADMLGLAYGQLIATGEISQEDEMAKPGSTIVYPVAGDHRCRLRVITQAGGNRGGDPKRIRELLNK